jgi:hypothetical protein
MKTSHRYGLLSGMVMMGGMAMTKWMKGYGLEVDIHGVKEGTKNKKKDDKK